MSSHSKILLVLALGVSSCGEPAPPTLNPPATVEDCKAFFTTVSEACASGKPEAVAKFFDLESIQYTVLQRALPKKQADEFNAGLIKGASQRHGMFWNLANIGMQGGALKMLRARTVDARTMMLVRMAGPSGVNYFDFDVTKDPDTGVMKASDVYIFLSGEKLTATLRRAVLPHLNRKRGLARLLSTEDLQIKHSETIQKITSLLGQSKAKEGMALLKSLPEELTQRKHLLFIRLSLSQLMEDEKEYVATLGMFRKSYPNDSCIDMLSIDWHTMKEDYAAAIQCVGRVRDSVGGDPYLDMMEGSLLGMAEDFGPAREKLNAALEAEPEFADIHFALLELARLEKAYPRMIERMAALEKLGHTFTAQEMRKQTEFEGFLASEVGKAWAEKQK